MKSFKQQRLCSKILKSADDVNMCTKFQKRIKSSCDKQDLVNLYKEGALFCLSNDYPSLEFIKEEFGDIIHANNIYVDEPLPRGIVNPSALFALGCTRGKVEYNEFAVDRIRVANTAKVEVVVKDNAFLMVDIYGNAEITLKAMGSARVSVVQYGGKIVDKSEESAKVCIKQNVYQNLKS